MKIILNIILLCTIASMALAQTTDQDNPVYKKRVLENTEIDFLMNYYMQDGENAATTGGNGTEELTDLSPSIIVAVPLNDDDVITITANISAYTSASSSNINPFDGSQPADPFVASSGASKSDTWTNIVANYSHSSDDRNKIWSGDISISNEFDYTSLGFGGSRTWLFNEKNTELNLNGNIYLDTWKHLYPVELRSYSGEGSQGFNRSQLPSGYSPNFSPLTKKKRNSYSGGIGFSQILSPRAVMYLSADYILQSGQLSTSFHRIYFADKPDYFYEYFHLADAIEKLPDSRKKLALGARLNYFINHRLTIRTFYRYYSDNWGITSHTAQLEMPIKLTDIFTLYPSYRFYNQTAADYFAPYNEHLSTEIYYTSDYDLSKFQSNNWGLGLSYTDVFTQSKIGLLALKSIDLKYNKYDRDSAFNASIFSFGVKFIIE